MKTNYLEYLKYILEHKRNIFKICWKERLYLHAFTHDLSKFYPNEFIPYAKWFYGEYGVKINNDIENKPISIRVKHSLLKDRFKKAFEKHYAKNKHHWNYWINQAMPEKYIIQMICDWKAMSLKFGGTAQEYYANNYDKIDLTIESRCKLEFNLGLIPGELLCSNVTWKQCCDNLGITMKEDLKRLGYID